MDLSSVLTVLGQILISAGLVFCMIGIYSVLAYKNFYARVVITSKIDTMGLVTLVFGFMLLSGSWIIVFKLAVLLVFDLLTAPLATTEVAHSAWHSGYKIRREFGRV